MRIVQGPRRRRLPEIDAAAIIVWSFALALAAVFLTCAWVVMRWGFGL